jgi:signal transduction histidine kinase
VLAFGGEAGGSPGRHYLAVIRDDSQQLQLASSLQARLALETLLAELSARFANLGEDEIDREIEKWLGSLAHMLDVDRSSFAELTPAGLAVTHSYARPGVNAHGDRPANLALPWLADEFRAGRMVVLSQIPDDLPERAAEERTFLAASGMKAAIGIPISIDGSVVCVLTFGAFRQPRTWSRDLISRVQLAGDVFANAIARRQSKHRLNQKQHELAHVGGVAAMGALASVIAHELDQPLTAVVSNAEAVRNLIHSLEPDLAEADDALRDIIDAAMRMSEIVRRERRLLKGSPGAVEQVDLNEAIREVELFIRAEARQYGVRVALGLLPGIPAVAGDRVQLQQVALNLARNGLQAMREEGTGARRELTIRTACDADHVVLTVTDAGPPADEALLERMFEPFYTTKANGLGMGLPISRSILDAHRGRIWATRNPDRGLTMHVAVPRK